MSILLALLLAGPPVSLGKPAITALPGAETAAQRSRRLQSTGIKVSRTPPALKGARLLKPAILSVNGMKNGVLTPGTDYVLAGGGFGSGGTLYVQTGGRMLPMQVIYWTDAAIGAHLPGDIGGLLDGNAQLNVVPSGKAPISTGAFRFEAAREDQILPVDARRFRTLGVAHPAQTGQADGWWSVRRTVSDGGGDKRCFGGGTDRIDIAMTPGFRVTGWGFSRTDPFVTNAKGDPETQARGAFAVRLDGKDPNGLFVDYGVLRYYSPKHGLTGGWGGCRSDYRIQVRVTGPKGVRP